jgi:hypothetical protein
VLWQQLRSVLGEVDRLHGQHCTAECAARQAPHTTHGLAAVLAGIVQLMR